jgi:hypothetical protein
MGDDQSEPFSQLVEAAISAHEMFKAYMQAGFTEDQALKLVVGLMRPPA